MSRPRRDIRPLSAHSPIRILTLMEQPSTTGLEFCLDCGQDFVSMARCTRVGSGTWWLVLRCGGCGIWHETFAQDEVVAALQRAIRRGVDAVSERVETFSQALELDLIGPGDFIAE